MTSPAEPLSGAGPAGPTDADLVEAMSAGSTAAARDLYRRHSGPAYALLLQILRDEESAREVLVDTFHQVWQQAHAYRRSRGTVAGWLLTIARSRAIDRRRATIRTVEAARRLAEAAPHFPGPRAPDPEAEAIRTDERMIIRRAVATLPEDQRRALELSFFAGLTHTQIADLLDQPLGTIKTRVRTALAKLRRALSRGADRS